MPSNNETNNNNTSEFIDVVFDTDSLAKILIGEIEIEIPQQKESTEIIPIVTDSHEESPFIQINKPRKSDIEIFMYTANEEIKKKWNNQDFKQKLLVIVYISIELYRLVISTLLVVFVPQNCYGTVCSIEQTLKSRSNLFTVGLCINIITFIYYILLYCIEIKREFKLIKYLEVRNDKPFDNNSVADTLEPLPITYKNKIYKIDYYYKIFTYGGCIIFLCNTVISGIVISNYSLGSQTINSFITNVLFMTTKLYHIYSVANTDKNVFYSVYLTENVQFNDIDPRIMEKIQSTSPENL